MVPLPRRERIKVRVKPRENCKVFWSAILYEKADELDYNSGARNGGQLTVREKLTKITSEVRADSKQWTRRRHVFLCCRVSAKVDHSEKGC